MNKRLMSAGVFALALLSLLAGLGQGARVAAQTGNGPQAFADPAFQRVWTRTDLLVQQGQAPRSWFWGPTPRATMQEPNQESPGGQRLVQYFDKSRMEINDPNGDKNSPFYVTNGLLTVELISGNMQIGAQAFSPRNPACINIAGDSDDPNAPTYASFRSVASVAPGVGRTDADKRGQVALTTIDHNGAVGNDSSKSGVSGGTYVYYEPATQHNIPQVFWQFLNQQGPVIENNQTVTRQLIVPWFYASGYPVSDAYWARVKVAGAYQDVLIQAYQRRVLTYNPSNQPAFQVEMGNIGLHYYDWRYNNIGICPAGSVTPVATTTALASTTAVPSTTVVGTATAVTSPTASATPSISATATATATPAATVTVAPLTGHIAWVSKRSGKKDIWIMNADGTTPQDLTGGPTSGDNYDPAISPDGNRLAFVSTRDGNPEIYVMASDGGVPTRLTNNPASDTHPAWSPDGTQIAFVSDRGTNANDVWVMNANGTNPVNITQQPGNDDDPAWGPDNRIAFVSHRSGSDQIYTCNPDGTALIQVTNGPGNNQLPAWNPAGTRLLFVSDRDGGNVDIYVMKPDGTSLARVTNLLSSEYDPTWSPDGRYIAYSSNRDGNFEIYVSYLDGTNLKRLTNDPADDVRPTWH